VRLMRFPWVRRQACSSAASAKKKSSTTTTKAQKKKSTVADVVELTASEDKGKGAIELEYVCSLSPGA
jgi:hypothetical protein